MSDTLYYIVCGVLTAGVLLGIYMMSRVPSAVMGNSLSAACTAAAIAITLYKYELLSDTALWIFLSVGFLIGIIGAYRVKMIEMPQAVALLNGFGGAASALVAVISITDDIGAFAITTAALALSVGTVTFTGSVVAAGKLHRLLPQKSIVLKGHRVITTALLIISVIFIIVFPFSSIGSPSLNWLIVGCTLFSGLFGIAFTIRVGGADMPITISLLNSLSGVAGSIAGMAISDPLLVAIGGIVGASGLLLTQIMCRAMNRSLSDILMGKTTIQHSSKAMAEQPVMAAAGLMVDNTPSSSSGETPREEKPHKTPSQMLIEAKSVIIVPGYGMALAQAQREIKRLADELISRGSNVMYAIHPVAGRMPGHMNVLLCEADVPYESLYEMDDINPLFESCDVAVVVGANDVINPAANTAEDTPIYGMPVLNVEKAKNIIICNYDLTPGYSGVPNPLYTKPGITLLLGDAKQSIQDILNSL